MIKRRNFIITGLGSSGTKFLAHIMNRSVRWHVVHEGICHDFDLEGAFLTSAQADLDTRPHYFGDINGFLLFHLLELRAGRKAVIIRNPQDTLLSWYCAKRGSLPPSFFSFHAGGYFALHDCIEHGIRCIRFERMVSDSDYLQRVLRYFGIVDVEVTSEMLASKINSKRDEFCKTYTDIDPVTRARFERASNTFNALYYEEEAPDFDDFLDNDVTTDEQEEERATASPVRRTSKLRDWEREQGLITVVAPHLDSLEGKLGLAGHLGPWIVEGAAATEETVELSFGNHSGHRVEIVIEARREGAAHFLRTRHLHFSHRGAACPESLQTVLRQLGKRLEAYRIEDVNALICQ